MLCLDMNALLLDRNGSERDGKKLLGRSHPTVLIEIQCLSLFRKSALRL